MPALTGLCDDIPIHGTRLGANEMNVLLCTRILLALQSAVYIMGVEALGWTESRNVDQSMHCEG